MKARLPLCFILVITAAGCDAETPPMPQSAWEPTPAPGDSSSAPAPASDAGAGAASSSPSKDVDSAKVLASIARGTYETSPTFTRVTRAPFPSVGAPGSIVSEWVSSFALDAYAAISPDASGSGATLPAGATIVRAVLDADGGVDKLTLMVKGPPGYNPDLGDWWFGVTDPQGTPLKDDAGAMLGKLSECYSCHIPRSTDGYLFGAPVDDRSAGDAGALQ